LLGYAVLIERTTLSRLKVPMDIPDALIVEDLIFCGSPKDAPARVLSTDQFDKIKGMLRFKIFFFFCFFFSPSS